MISTLRPNKKRAQQAITLLYVMLAVTVFSLLLEVIQYILVRNLIDGKEYSETILVLNDLLQAFSGIVGMAMNITFWIIFIRWFRRAYYNLHTQVRNLNHAEGWAAGSWFVPIISLYRPYQIMKELYEETKRLLFRFEITTNREILSTQIFGIWWALWLIKSFIGNRLVVMGFRDNTLEGMKVLASLSIFYELITIVVWLMLVQIVKTYSEVEPLLFKAEEKKRMEAIYAESESSEVRNDFNLTERQL